MREEGITMRRITIAATAAAVLAAPAAAQAHVTLQPQEVPAGSFARLDVRVPNERDDAGTVKVQVQFPDGIASASYESVPGWRVKVVKEQAPEPIDLHGEEVTEQIDTITFTGDGKQGIVRPGEFRDFGLSLRTPDGEPGESVTFKAVQTYESGEVVRWIGPEDSDDPAPTVTLAAAPGAHGGSSSSSVGAQEPAAAGDTPTQSGAEAPVAAENASAATTESSDGGGDGLAIAALIVGALGLIAGLAGVMMGRRARNERTRSAPVPTQP
jgi:periplasmic copper chaperone A